MKQVFYEYNNKNLKINKLIDFGSYMIFKEASIQTIIINLVEQMLHTKKQQQTAVTERDKSYLEQKCNSIDTQINALVYKLYNLTDEETNIIENS